MMKPRYEDRLTMQSSQNLIMAFADAEHDAGLGYLDTLFLRMSKDFETLLKRCPSVSHIRRHCFYSFNIVCIDIQP